MGTLVYGSSQETEARAGAALIQVPPVRQGLHRNLLRTTTYFYPGTLLPLEHRHLPPDAGFLGHSLAELRAALRIALEIARGSCLGHGAPPDSRRGRIVVLSPALARATRPPAAAILTEPLYSREANYQILLPLFDATGRRAGPNDLLLDGRLASGVFANQVQHVMASIPIIHSVWHAQAIARETEQVLDDSTLAEIDRRLCDYFSLPPSG